jgi:hypothetical protein
MTGEDLSLRELIDEAIDDFETYKNPDVSDVQDMLHEILVAGDMGGISHDKLESLYWRRSGKIDVLTINTSYSVRSCNKTAEHEIPVSIIDAPDPIYAVKELSLNKKVAVARNRMLRAEEELKRETENYGAALEALKNFGTEGK